MFSFKEGTPMKIRTRVLIGVAAISCGIVGIVHATPIVGLIFGTILATGTTNEEIMQNVRVALPPVAGQEAEDRDDHDNEWRAKLYTSGPTGLYVQDVEYAPAAIPDGTRTREFW
jgi:hypothetical protein